MNNEVKKRSHLPPEVLPSTSGASMEYPKEIEFQALPKLGAPWGKGIFTGVKAILDGVYEGYWGVVLLDVLVPQEGFGDNQLDLNSAHAWAADQDGLIPCRADAELIRPFIDRKTHNFWLVEDAGPYRGLLLNARTGQTWEGDNSAEHGVRLVKYIRVR